MSQTSLQVRYRPVRAVNARFKGPPLVKAHAMYWHAIRASVMLRDTLCLHLARTLQHEACLKTSPATRGSDRV